MKKFLLLFTLVALTACHSEQNIATETKVSILPRSAQRIVPGLPSYNPSWYAQSHVYWDPAGLTPGTSDNNTCTDLAHPCTTFGEILLRYGSNAPELPCGQSIVVHKLSAQTPAQQTSDPVWFEPKMCRGQAQFIDTLVLLDGGADVVVSTVTPKQYDAGTPSGGQLLLVQGLPAAAAPGMFVCDVTQGNSCAFIDSMVDAGVANMQQPLSNASFNMPDSGAPAPAEVNSWTTGDTVNVFTENATGLKWWNPVAGDVSDAGSGLFSGGWVQFTNIVDTSGQSPPASEYPLMARGVNGIAGCKVDPRTHASLISGRVQGYYLIGNTHTGALNTTAGATGQVFGGGYTNGISVVTGTGLRVGGDSIVHGTIGVSGILSQCSFYAANSMLVTADGVVDCETAGALPLWGPGTLDIQGIGQVQYYVGWTNFFMTGALTVRGGATGCFLSGLDAGAITCNVPVTKTNLITNHTLKSFNYGATYTDGTGAN